MMRESGPERATMRRRTLLEALMLSATACASGLSLADAVQAALPREIYDVTDFGAKGDGQSDDTAAIRTAMARAAASQNSTHVYFPKGRYIFSFLEEQFDDVEVSGDAAVLVSTLPIGTPQPAIWLHAKRLWVHDIAIDYTEAIDVRQPGVVERRKPNAYGLRLGGARDPHLWNAELVRVERVQVSNARGGGIQVSYASNVTVRGCRVRQVLGNGLGFDDCVANVLAEDNDIALTGDDLLVIVTDFRVPDGTRNVIFRRNTVAQGYAKGIASSGVSGMLIEDNSVSETFAGGIVVFSDSYYGLGKSTHVTVRGNTVKRAGRFFGKGQFRNQASSVGSSIYVAGGSEDVTIRDNTLIGSVRDGIVVTTIKDLSIVKNTVLDHPGVGILVGDPTDNDKTRISNFQITLNTVQGNRDGIIVGSATNGTITGNTIALKPAGKGRALFVAKSNAVTVQK
jgi:parallel beta-helix repeat protein